MFAPLSSILRIDCRAKVGAFDIFDDLLAGAITCSSCLSHLPLLGGDDEPRTLSYQISLIGPISADVRHLQPAEQMFAIAQAMLADAWKVRLKQAQMAKDTLAARIKEIDG